MANITPAGERHHIFTNIFAAVADPFQRSQGPEDFQPVFHGVAGARHFISGIAQQLFIFTVDTVVLIVHFQCRFLIEAGKGIKSPSHHGYSLLPYRQHTALYRHIGGQLLFGYQPGDPLYLIAHAFNIGDGLGDNHNQAQIAGSRVALGDDA